MHFYYDTFFSNILHLHWNPPSYLDLSLRIVLNQVLQLSAEHWRRHAVQCSQVGNQTTTIWHEKTSIIRQTHTQNHIQSNIRNTYKWFTFRISICAVLKFSNCWIAAAGLDSAHTAALTSPSLHLPVSGLQQPDPTYAAKQRRKAQDELRHSWTGSPPVPLLNSQDSRKDWVLNVHSQIATP